jgi:hypothetical protein
MEAVGMCLAVLSLGPVAVSVLFADGMGMVPVAGNDIEVPGIYAFCG